VRARAVVAVALAGSAGLAGLAGLAGCGGRGDDKGQGGKASKGSGAAAASAAEGGPEGKGAKGATGAASSARAGAEPAPWSDAWLDRERARYLDDPSYRRAQLEASLTNHANTYSQQRLGAYGLRERGWDVLPVWNPRSRPVTAALAAELERGKPPVIPESQAPLWDGRAPTTPAGWIALGRRVFFEYPLRAEASMEWALTKPAVAASLGVERTSDGSVPGLVAFADLDGKSRVGITCAMCHTTVRGGALVTGAARRSFDAGKLRLAYSKDTRAALDPRLAQRMASWGPGRADVTEDNEDPVAIPDLWGLRAQSALTAAGTIQHTGPVALALRQETQLLHTNHERVRPPRELAWALAMFLYSLEPPPRPPPRDPARVARGQELFGAHCKRCHSNAAYGGTPVSVESIGTDPALANGPGRGTGRYRPPPLLGVADGAPYLHHGAVSSLDELLSAARFAPGYRAGRLGPGPIPGHRPGTGLGDEDRAALIAFLETL
jgi:cytochrome c5